MIKISNLKSQNFNILLYFGVFILFLIVIFIFRDISSRVMPFTSLESRIKPTSVPFRELTIPYLRERTYKSSLGNLEKAYENENYIAYITDYISDGLKVNGLLTIPKGEDGTRKYPAVVFIHGYIPPSQYQTQGLAYFSYVDYLASNGFVVFKIDLRGHGDSEGEPGGAYYSSDYIIDTLNAYSALASSDFVDSSKIGLWGHSMAGNIVMRSLAASPDIPAAVIWAGAVYTYEDMQKYRIRDLSYQPPADITRQPRRRRELFEKYGSPSGQIKFWKEVAPSSFLKDLKGAIQIHHSVDDDVVNIGYSRDLNKLLDKTKVPHEFYEYPSGGHNIADSNFSLAMERTVEFFKKYLLR